MPATGILKLTTKTCHQPNQQLGSLRTCGLRWCCHTLTGYLRTVSQISVNIQPIHMMSWTHVLNFGFRGRRYQPFISPFLSWRDQGRFSFFQDFTFHLAQGQPLKNPQTPNQWSRDPRPASFGSTLTCRSWAPPKIRHPKKKEPSSQVAWKIHGPWNLCHHSLHLISSSQQLVVIPLNFCGTFAHPRSAEISCGCMSESPQINPLPKYTTAAFINMSRSIIHLVLSRKMVRSQNFTSVGWDRLFLDPTLQKAPSPPTSLVQLALLLGGFPSSGDWRLPGLGQRKRSMFRPNDAPRNLLKSTHIHVCGIPQSSRIQREGFFWLSIHIFVEDKMPVKTRWVGCENLFNSMFT